MMLIKIRKGHGPGPGYPVNRKKYGSTPMCLFMSCGFVANCTKKNFTMIRFGEFDIDDD